MRVKSAARGSQAAVFVEGLTDNLRFESTPRSACFLGATAVTLIVIYSVNSSAELRTPLAAERVGEKSLGIDSV